MDNIDADILSGNWKVIVQQSGRFYFHADGLGSVVALSDRDGRTVETYRYDVFGRTVVYDGDGRRPRAASAVGNPYFFTGRRLDFETGLYYYRARMYSPNLGRFLQTDPIGYADSINWYAYCGNNPVVFVDPLGLCGKGIGNYLKKSGKQFLLGDFTDDVTLLGTGFQVGTGILGIDLPADIRDIAASFVNWEWSWGHAGKTALNVAAVLPIVGALKYSDEAATLVKKGGIFNDVRKANVGGEFHHIPSKSVGGKTGIHMDISDHRKTGSWGNYKDAQEYRTMEKQLIDQGRIDAAVEMGFDDIQSKFGNKYDKHLLEMIDNL